MLDPGQDEDVVLAAFRRIWDRLSLTDIDSGHLMTMDQVAAGANTPSYTSISECSGLWFIYVDTDGAFSEYIGRIYVRIIGEELERAGVDCSVFGLPETGIVWDAFVASTARVH